MARRARLFRTLADSQKWLCYLTARTGAAWSLSGIRVGASGCDTGVAGMVLEARETVRSFARLIPGGAPLTAGGSKSIELQQIVRGADDLPLRIHFVQAAQEKLPEAPALFDLTEDRLDDALPQTIHGLRFGLPGLRPQPFQQRPVARPTAGFLSGTRLRHRRQVQLDILQIFIL